jgi:hypothetical protein
MAVSYEVIGQWLPNRRARPKNLYKNVTPTNWFSISATLAADSTAAATKWLAFEKLKGSVRRVVELAELLRLPADTTTVRTLRWPTRHPLIEHVDVVPDHFAGPDMRGRSALSAPYGEYISTREAEIGR